MADFSVERNPDGSVRSMVEVGQEHVYRHATKLPEMGELKVGDLIPVGADGDRWPTRKERRACAKKGHQQAHVRELNVIACRSCGTVLGVDGFGS